MLLKFIHRQKGVKFQESCVFRRELACQQLLSGEEIKTIKKISSAAFDFYSDKMFVTFKGSGLFRRQFARNINYYCLGKIRKKISFYRLLHLSLNNLRLIKVANHPNTQLKNLEIRNNFKQVVMNYWNIAFQLQNKPRSLCCDGAMLVDAMMFNFNAWHSV